MNFHKHIAGKLSSCHTGIGIKLHFETFVETFADIKLEKIRCANFLKLYVGATYLPLSSQQEKKYKAEETSCLMIQMMIKLRLVTPKKNLFHLITKVLKISSELRCNPLLFDSVGLILTADQVYVWNSTIIRNESFCDLHRNKLSCLKSVRH